MTTTFSVGPEDFYCEPPEEATAVDLRKGDDLQQLCLCGCKSIRIVDDFIPPVVRYINISQSGIERLDLTGLTNLEQLILDDVPGLELRGGFIPPSTQFISATGRSCASLPLESVSGLRSVALAGNEGVRVGQRMPANLSVFDAAGVSFGALDFKACQLIFVIVVEAAELLVASTERLEIVEIAGKRLKGDACKRFAATCRGNPVQQLLAEAARERRDIAEMVQRISGIAQ